MCFFENTRVYKEVRKYKHLNKMSFEEVDSRFGSLSDGGNHSLQSPVLDDALMRAGDDGAMGFMPAPPSVPNSPAGENPEMEDVQGDEESNCNLEEYDFGWLQSSLESAAEKMDEDLDNETKKRVAQMVASSTVGTCMTPKQVKLMSHIFGAMGENMRSEMEDDDEGIEIPKINGMKDHVKKIVKNGLGVGKTIKKKTSGGKKTGDGKAPRTAPVRVRAPPKHKIEEPKNRFYRDACALFLDYVVKAINTLIKNGEELTEANCLKIFNDARKYLDDKYAEYAKAWSEATKEKTEDRTCIDAFQTWLDSMFCLGDMERHVRDAKPRTPSSARSQAGRRSFGARTDPLSHGIIGTGNVVLMLKTHAEAGGENTQLKKLLVTCEVAFLRLGGDQLVRFVGKKSEKTKNKAPGASMRAPAPQNQKEVVLSMLRQVNAIIEESGKPGYAEYELEHSATMLCAYKDLYELYKKIQAGLPSPFTIAGFQAIKKSAEQKYTQGAQAAGILPMQPAAGAAEQSAVVQQSAEAEPQPASDSTMSDGGHMSREQASHESVEDTRGTDGSGSSGEEGVKKYSNPRLPSCPLRVSTRTRSARTSEATTDDVSGMKNGQVNLNQGDSDEEASDLFNKAMGGDGV